MATTRSLQLHVDQLQVLAQIGIDTEKLHFIGGDRLHPTAVRVDGYASGHYILFTEGNVSDHQTFMQYLFGREHRPVLQTLYLDLFIYKSPTAEFVKTENLVSVVSTTDPSVLY
jgi:hypothetical protein